MYIGHTVKSNKIYKHLLSAWKNKNLKDQQNIILENKYNIGTIKDNFKIRKYSE